MRFKLIFFAIVVFVCAIGVGDSRAGWVGFGYATHIDCKCLATGVTQSFGLASDTFTQAQLDAACDTEYGATSCTAPVPDASVVINSVDNPTAIPLAKGTATGAGITERGFYWWIPPTSENHFGGSESGLLPEGGSGAGAFSLSLSALKPLNTYHIKAYIRVGGQLITSDELLFTTGAARVPALITKSDYMTCRRDILVKGEITDVGSSPVDIYGFVYAAHPNPTVFDRALAFAWDTTLPLSQGKAFEGTIKGLVPEKYCFRAYAHNAQGTAYGAEYCFVIDGNIEVSNKYAWNENAGWLNFNSQGGVSVFSDHLEGYVWNENAGWIKIGAFTAGTKHTYSNASKTDYGVNNDGSGNLSGYGWSENVGWINFRPVGGGVFIDPSGDFSGYAWGENIGWIHFANTTPAYRVSSNFNNTSCTLVVHTNQDVTVNESEASVKGEITDVGSSAIEAYGFVYAAHTIPTVNDKTLDMSAPSTFSGTFSGTITGLAPGKYYLRAYAKNAQETVYGEEISFTINGPGFTVSPTTGLITTESGGTATFTVKLNRQPTADVAVSVSSSDTEEGTVSPASLTFTSQNWDNLQTVTVTGVDDNVIDGDQNYTVKLAAAVSDDPFYNNLKPDDVAVVNRDNDGNHAPEADLQTLSTEQDQSLSITLTGRDQDNDNITYSVTADPQHGVLTGSAPILTYTPTTGFFGADSFTFKTYDGKLYSDDAKIAITVISMNGNHAPKADPQTLSTDQDKALSILLTGSDEDGNIITYSVVGNPQHGQLSGNAPNLTYTPTSGYFGADSFTFRTYDGKLYSDAATVAVTVKQIAAPVNPPVQYVNYPPTADEQTLITDQDKALKITLTGKDQNGDALSFAVVKQPANGKITGTAPDLIYTPNPGFYGQDNFTFRTNDGASDSTNIATVRITVKKPNYPPTADEQTLITDQDKALKITLTGSDPEGSMLSFAIVKQPANGKITGTAPDLIYTPNPGFYGQDNFTFKVNDGLWTSDTATVQITVKKSNYPPKADDQTLITEHNKALKITLTGSDPDGDPITYLMVKQPASGQLTGTAPNLTYTPNKGFSGTDSFTFKTNDGKADSVVATVKMTVKPNQPPKADDQTLTAKNDRDLKIITLTGSDPDGDPLTYLIVRQPAHGQLTGTAPNLTYTPNKDFSGTDSFTFKTNDGKADSVVATVKITVKPNQPPNAASVTTWYGTQNKALNFWLYGSDPDGDTITYSFVSNPQHGQLSGNALNLTYTPNKDFIGEDSFTYKVNDGKMDSTVATVTIFVELNHPPTASGQTRSTDDFDTVLQITLTGSDKDQDPLTYLIVSQPGKGQLTGTAPNLTYKQTTGEKGVMNVDSFTFKVNDGKLDSEVATVGISNYNGMRLGINNLEATIDNVGDDGGKCAFFIAASSDAGNSLPSAGILFVLIGLGLAGLLYDEKRVK